MKQSAVLTRDFKDIRRSDGAAVGGKNASLGELVNALAPQGVATVRLCPYCADILGVCASQRDPREHCALACGVAGRQGNPARDRGRNPEALPLGGMAP